jgi:hypothetical protein
MITGPPSVRIISRRNGNHRHPLTLARSRPPTAAELLEPACRSTADQYPDERLVFANSMNLAIPDHLAPILDRLGLDRSNWVETVSGFSRMFKQAAGRSSSLMDAAARSSRRRFTESNEKPPAGTSEGLSSAGFCAHYSEDRSGIAHGSLRTGVHRRDPTSAIARQPINHDRACTGLYSGASWEQIGNSIGNVSPMRPQCEKTKVATCQPWIRRL